MTGLVNEPIVVIEISIAGTVFGSCVTPGGGGGGRFKTGGEILSWKSLAPEANIDIKPVAVLPVESVTVIGNVPVGAVGGIERVPWIWPSLPTWELVGP